MRYKLQTAINAAPEEVWADLHRYKETGDAEGFLPSRIVRKEFKVLSPRPTGVGATYWWRFSLLGMALLTFTEKVIEWRENQAVAYESKSGGHMLFRVALRPVPGGTQVYVDMEYTLNSSVLDRLVYPLVRWGLPRVFSKMQMRLKASRAS